VTGLHPRVSVSAVSSFGFTFEQDRELWSSIGAGQVGLLQHKLDAAGWERSLAAVVGDGLAVSSLVGTPVLPLDEPGAWPALRQVLLRSVEGAAAVGAGCVFVGGAPGRLDADAAGQVFPDALCPVRDRAETLGVALAFEHTNPLRRDLGFIHSLADAVEYAETSGIGIDVELNNCWVERHLAASFARGLPAFRLVQVSDFVVGTVDTPNRAVPGDGDIPLARLVGMLLDAGYTGPFDLELIGPRIEAEGYASAIGRGSRWLSDLLWSRDA
jgi:sugar phosphate isomerase/epimerase